MSKILAYTSPARGHLFPAAAVLSQMQSRGHQVAIRTLASEVRLMRSVGFSATALDPRVEAVSMRDWMSGSPQKALASAVETFIGRARFDAEDLQRAIAEEDPDALLVDINSWGALAAAEQWGGPWSVFCPYPLPLRSHQVPPYGPGLPPARGLLGQLRDAMLRPVLSGTLERKMMPGVNAVRAQVGLPGLRALDEQFRRAPLLIYMTAEPFEYHRDDWPTSVVMVGPCEWEPQGRQQSALTDSGRPLVVVTTSSEFQNDAAIVQVALEGLADEDVDVVATVPSGDLPTLVPANATVARFLPHGPLLDRASCAVTHGGMGATQKALARGVPVCAVPFGRDQLEVARRVQIAGAGTRLSKSRLSPQRLRRSVKRAMAMTEGARRVQRGYEIAGGPPAAADAIEHRLLS